MLVNSAIYYKVEDAITAVTSDFLGSIQMLADMAIRNELGTRNIIDILYARKIICHEIEVKLLSQVFTTSLFARRSSMSLLDPWDFR